MKLISIIFSVLLMLLLINCSSVTVKTDFDPEYDFATFKMYRWANAKELNPDDELAKHPLIFKRVQAAVDTDLKAKGFELTESDNYDFVMMAHAGVKEKTQVTQTGGHYGGWYDPYWGPYGGSTHVSTYEVGTLVLDVVHWENKELAWRGMGTSMLEDYDNQEKVTEYINNWVGKIMAQFPPKK
jgi:hypothetical protein